MLADGSMPMLPVSIEASSDRMSPKMLPVTIVSNCPEEPQQKVRGQERGKKSIRMSPKMLPVKMVSNCQQASEGKWTGKERAVTDTANNITSCPCCA